MGTFVRPFFADDTVFDAYTVSGLSLHYETVV